MNEEVKTERSWTYTDEAGVNYFVSKAEYQRLWMDRYIRAGGINPSEYCGRKACLTIESGDHQDEMGSPSKLVLDYQQHYIELLGLSIFYDALSDGMAFKLRLPYPLELSLTLKTEIRFIGARTLWPDLYNDGEEGNYLPTNYKPYWIIGVYDRPREEDRPYYIIPFQLELL
jgi:hypothetical protein